MDLRQAPVAKKRGFGKIIIEIQAFTCPYVADAELSHLGVKVTQIGMTVKKLS